MSKMENVVKQVNEMSDAVKMRTYNAAKAEFDRISHQRKAMDELRWLAEGYGQFHHVGDWMIVEVKLNRERGEGFFIFDKRTDKGLGEYYRSLPVALIALAEVIGKIYGRDIR